MTRLVARLAPALLFVFVSFLHGAEPPYTRTADVIYGRKFGMALTMDVFQPAKPNGVGIVSIMSGGWFSSHDSIKPPLFQWLLQRGYTVFAVVHGSQPKFTIPEAIADMNRAVRFIRYHAKDYGIDPNRIGVTGGSAGGHLSLMLGTAGTEGSKDPKVTDPVEKVSSRVQAVACFFPPTDFLNYGAKGHIALGWGTLAFLRAPFDFHEFDKNTHAYERILDPNVTLKIARQISPIYHISKDTPPTLIMHGDADHLVPIEQSQRFIAKLKALGVPAKLVVKHGASHGWDNMGQDTPVLADWFDKYLGVQKSQVPHKPRQLTPVHSRIR
jgi:acetyl esterase/lipase